MHATCSDRLYSGCIEALLQLYSCDTAIGRCLVQHTAINSVKARKGRELGIVGPLHRIAVITGQSRQWCAMQQQETAYLERAPPSVLWYTTADLNT